MPRTAEEAIVKPVVDSDLCIGCGLCEEMCPEVFAMGEDGIARVIAADPTPELYGPVRDCADMCPTEAISITE